MTPECVPACVQAPPVTRAPVGKLHKCFFYPSKTKKTGSSSSPPHKFDISLSAIFSANLGEGGCFSGRRRCFRPSKNGSPSSSFGSAAQKTSVVLFVCEVREGFLFCSSSLLLLRRLRSSRGEFFLAVRVFSSSCTGCLIWRSKRGGRNC